MSIWRRMQMAGASYLSAWNISEAYWPAPATGYFSVSAQDTSPVGLFFKPDGTKMYVVGQQNDNVYEYNLSTAWDIATASYLQNFSVATQESVPQGLFFKFDGTKMYVVGAIGDDVNEYDLSTAWDISTASYLQNFSVAAQDTAPTEAFFKPDGSKMYVVGQQNDNVYEYDLSTAWDVSTASYLQNFSVATQEISPQGLFFKSDGLKMYVVGVSNSVYEYDLSTAWDVSSASYLQSFSLSTSLQNGIFFKPDGTKMYLSSNGEDAVLAYDLSTAWDVSTASENFVLPVFVVSAQEPLPTDLFFKPDGTKMYVVGQQNDTVYEYDLSTPWDVTTASYLQGFSVAAQETSPNGFFFKPDGTKFYIVGAQGDDISEYDISTAWDISTASYLQNFSVATEDTAPSGVFFKPDGTKMYVVGSAGSDVNEYDLSTAWDISTASYSQNFSVSTQDTLPTGLFFKPDGTKMYLIGFNSDAAYEYDLSTAWDISTASYLQNFSVSAQESLPRGIFFMTNGARMYIIGQGGDEINQYDLY